MIDAGHILDLALLIAGHRSACVTDHTLPMTHDMTHLMITPTEGTRGMTRGMTHLMIAPTEGTDTGLYLEVPLLIIPIMKGTVTGLFLEVSHPGQEEGQGGVTHEVPLLFQREVTRKLRLPGHGGVIQEALRGVVKVQNATQEAQV